MVRNNKGGKKGKNVGRKHLVGGFTQKGLRVAEEEGEIYAGVTKMLGNGRVEVRCLDNKLRQCVIRQKFRGRGKRDNTIDIASWVLVVIRDWETTVEGKQETCDLLKVYNQNEVNSLLKLDIDWKVFSSVEDKNGNKMFEDDSGVNFVADIEESGNNNIQITTIAHSTIVMDNDDDSIDFDDI